MTTYFDYLPVELLHTIFQFLSKSDVIWSFYNLTPYLNSVLNHYSWFDIDLQFISKCRFDFICNHLVIEQIHSLTLSDNIPTPGQVQLFFTRFHLRDFLNLHSLTLRAITNNELSLILSDLPKLNNLKRLITDCRSTQPLLLGQILNQLTSLEHLSVSQGDIFDHNIPFPLRHLKTLNAGTCHFLELCRLQFIVPSLISLKINLQANHQLQLLENYTIWSSLEQLDLTLNGNEEFRSLDQTTTTTTFDELEPFLAHFHNLKSLTLNIRGLSDKLADGDRWESCATIRRLQKFHFLIEFVDTPINPNEIFNSFSSPFWREIKKWYVVITTHYICTVSCFTDQLLPSSTSPPLTTSPDHRWFYRQTKQIKVNQNNSRIDLHQFPNLKQLDFSDENIPLSMIGYSRLRHLIFHQPISSDILNEILKHHSHINHLTLSQNDVHQLSSWKSIHYLHFQDSIQFKHRTQIKELARVFSSIKQLSIHLNSTKLIPQIIDSFHRLENAIFHFRELLKPIAPEWLKETYRSEPNRVLVWISNTVSGRRSTMNH